MAKKKRESGKKDSDIPQVGILHLWPWTIRMLLFLVCICIILFFVNSGYLEKMAKNDKVPVESAKQIVLYSLLGAGGFFFVFTFWLESRSNASDREKLRHIRIVQRDEAERINSQRRTLLNLWRHLNGSDLMPTSVEPLTFAQLEELLEGFVEAGRKVTLRQISELKEAEAKSARLQGDLDIAREAIRQSEGTKTTLQAEVNRLRTALQLSVDESSRLSTVHQDSQRLVDKLQGKLSSARNELGEFIQACINLLQELSRAKQLILNLRKELAFLEGELQEGHQQYDQVLLNLEAKDEEVLRVMEEAGNAETMATTTADELHQTIRELEAEALRLSQLQQQTVASAGEAMDLLRAEKATLEAQRDKLQGELATTSASAESLRDQLLVSGNTNQERQKRIDTLAAEISELQGRLLQAALPDPNSALLAGRVKELEQAISEIAEQANVLLSGTQSNVIGKAKKLAEVQELLGALITELKELVPV